MDLGVTKVTIQSAGPVFLGSKLAGAAKTFFSTFFIVIVALGIIFYVFVANPKALPFAHMNRELFQFARFENAGGDDEVALAIDEPELKDSAAAYDETTPSKAFDNPMYGTTGIANQSVDFDSKNSKREMTHVNPMYSELLRREGTTKGKEEMTEEQEEEMEKEEEEDNKEDSDDTIDEESGEEKESAQDEGVFDQILFN